MQPLHQKGFHLTHHPPQIRQWRERRRWYAALNIGTWFFCICIQGGLGIPCLLGARVNHSSAACFVMGTPCHAPLIRGKQEDCQSKRSGQQGAHSRGWRRGMRHGIPSLLAPKRPMQCYSLDLHAKFSSC